MKRSGAGPRHERGVEPAHGHAAWCGAVPRAWKKHTAVHDWSIMCVVSLLWTSRRP